MVRAGGRRTIQHNRIAKKPVISMKELITGFLFLTESCKFPYEKLRQNARPELSSAIENLDNYRVIFLGYPNWNADLPIAPTASPVPSRKSVWTIWFSQKEEVCPINAKRRTQSCFHGASAIFVLILF